MKKGNKVEWWLSLVVSVLAVAYAVMVLGGVIAEELLR